MADLNAVLNKGDSLNTPGLGAAIGGSSNRELMTEARLALSGNWGMALLGYILYTVLVMSFSLFVVSAVVFVTIVTAASGADVEVAMHAMQLFANILAILISGAFIVGFSAFFLGVSEEGAARLELLFVGFQRFFKSFGTYFFYNLFILLWSLLFIIPGIIATFRYAMAFFILADDDTCGPLEALSRSKEMMKGNKWKLFCLHWRFLGWWLLATVFTLGIGYLWLVPYMQTSFAKFYEDVK